MSSQLTALLPLPSPPIRLLFSPQPPTSHHTFRWYLCPPPTPGATYHGGEIAVASSVYSVKAVLQMCCNVRPHGAACRRHECCVGFFIGRIFFEWREKGRQACKGWILECPDRSGAANGTRYAGVYGMGANGAALPPESRLLARSSLSGSASHFALPVLLHGSTYIAVGPPAAPPHLHQHSPRWSKYKTKSASCASRRVICLYADLMLYVPVSTMAGVSPLRRA